MHLTTMTVLLLPLAFAAQAPAPTPTITGLKPAQNSALQSYLSSLSHDTQWSSSYSSIASKATWTSEYNFFNSKALRCSLSRSTQKRIYPLPQGAEVSDADSELYFRVTATTRVDTPKISSGVPGEIKDHYSSVYKKMLSISSKQATATQIGNNAAAKETGLVKVAGMAAAGILGVAGVL